MPIMASTLYRDMFNFFRHQFTNILVLALLSSLISFIISYTLSPNIEQLMALNDNTNMIGDISIQQFIQQMSVEQQRILLQASAAGTFASLVGNVLLTGGLLTMIRLVSDRKHVNVLRAISLSVPLLPRLLLLIFLTTLLVQLGLLLVIIPGIILAIFLSMAPVIATSNNTGALKSMRMSTSLAYANLRLLAPIVLFWMLTKAVILLLAPQFTLVSTLIKIVLLNSLSNLISSLLLIYLYRLYMLLMYT